MHRSIWAGALVAPLVFALGCGSKSPTTTPEVWTVQGVVTDAVTAKPISGATAELFAGAAGVTKTTDSTGFFLFTNVAQGTSLIVTVTAPGYLTSTVHVSSPPIPESLSDGGTATLAPLIDASTALTPIPTPADAGPPPTWTVQGTVTDSSTGLPLPGATATVYNGSATTLTGTTDADGVYAITGLTNAQDLIVDFSKNGYSSSNSDVSGSSSYLQVINVSGSLTPLVVNPLGGFTIQGWVYASANPANGATVWLWDNTTFAYSTSATADSTGKFIFTGVAPSDYELRVFPYAEGDAGISDYRIFCEELGEIDACTSNSGSTTTDQTGTVGGTCSSNINLSDIVIELQEKSHDIGGGSFVSLSTVSGANPTGYPLEQSDLAHGVTGILQDGASPIFLQFDSEVDPTTVDLELFEVDASTPANQGTPVTTTQSWDSNVILTITPSSALGSSQDPDQQYELKINSLSFADGTVMFSEVTPSFGKITFDVQTLGTPLANPTPQLYVANETDLTLPNNPRTAVNAIVDSETLWLVDGNNDFLFGYNPANHWTNSTGFQLSWPAISGAVSYNLYARNNSVPSGANVDALQWQPINGSVETGVDPNGQPTIYASGVMQFEFGDFGKAASGPFSYGNEVDVAVTSVDRNGFESPIDPSKLLPLKDGELPFLAGAINDDPFLAGALTANTELGNSFTKVMLFTFSEDMNTTGTPTVTPLSGNLTLAASNPITDVSWSPSNPNTPVQDSNQVAMNVHLRSRGTCTEVMANRTIGIAGSPVPGDSIIPVLDTDYFSPNASQSIIFVNPSLAAPAYYQADGVSNITTNQGLIQLSSALTSTTGGSIPQGDLACSIAISAGNLTTLTNSTAATNTATVGSSSIFYIGEQILVILPGSDTTRFSMITTIVFNDTTTNTIITANPIDPATFTGGTLVIPIPTAEDQDYLLRGQQSLLLRADAAVGGASVDLELSPFSGAQLMVGDSILVDRDGDLNTTSDQAVLTVQQVKSTNNDPTWGIRLRATVNLPNNVLPLLDSSNAQFLLLGDAFQVGGVQDTSATGASLNPRQNTVSGSNIIQ